jgi:rhamnosyltransferase
VAELVSVVIPTLDGADTLPGVLDALERQRAPFAFEVVAVDSGSRDGTLELLRERPLRLCEIPPQDFDHGETRNLAVRLARGDPVVLLTQDARPCGEGFLASLVAPFADRRVAGVYGRQVPRPDCDVVTRRQLESWLTGRSAPARAELAGRSWEGLSPLERFELCTFDNVCSAIRRAAWEEVPFPRTSFGEDLGWGREVIRRGWQIAYQPLAAVEHSHRRSLLYEWRRTRACHARLYELFGLATVPRARHVLRAVLANWRSDLPYVWRHAPGGSERLRQLGRIGGLSVVGPLAQYLGARDARRAAAGAGR